MSSQQSAFRLNIQVVKMVGVVFVALAVPLALVAVGIKRYSSGQTTPAPEQQGLRAALEQAADKSFPVPEPMSDGRSVFVLSSPGSASDAKKAVEESARKLGGTVLPLSAGRQGEERLLVQIPRSASGSFEAGCLRPFAESQHGHATGGSRQYEIVFPAP